MQWSILLVIIFLLSISLACSDSVFKGDAEKEKASESKSSDGVAMDQEDLPFTRETVDLPVVADATETTIAAEAVTAPISVPAPEPAPIGANVPNKPIFAECAEEPDRAIVADLYQLNSSTTKLPDYSQLAAIKKICLSQLDIKRRTFSEGFPGVAALFEWFSLDMNFKVNIPQDGVWTFKLIADDGAILYINDQKIIDNDGLHEALEKEATVDLKAGMQKFRVSYFQGPRFDIALELLWKAPNATEFSYIPRAYISRTGN